MPSTDWPSRHGCERTPPAYHRCELAGETSDRAAGPRSPVRPIAEDEHNRVSRRLRRRRALLHLSQRRIPRHQIPETIGGGVAVLDYDGDGWLDVYLVQGGPRQGDPGRAVDNRDDGSPFALAPNGDRLFRNRRDGTFRRRDGRVGHLAGSGGGYAFGVTVGDYDGDGRPDLFVTRFGSYALLPQPGRRHVRGRDRERAGLGGDRDWPTSAAFADLDGDGDLDLYVCHYLAWDVEHPTLCHDTPAPGPSSFPVCRSAFRRGPIICSATTAAISSTSPQSAGIVDHDGRGLGVVAADLDDDGRIDLFVANDMTANYLFRNLGNMKFEEVGHLAGVACNADGGYQAGMGVACGDLDGDGRAGPGRHELLRRVDHVLSATWRHGLFADATAAVGLKAPSRFLLGFGITFLDVDNDGCLDLATANGHVSTTCAPKSPYAMPAQLLTGDSQGPIDRRHARQRRGLERAKDRPRTGRAATSTTTVAVDLLLVAQNSPLAYLHNQTERAGHFITLRLKGNRVQP